MTQEEFGPPWTVLKLIRWTTQFFEKKNIPNPRLDTELLLSHALNLERIMLYAHFDRPLEADELTSYRALVKRRGKFEPIAYITGSCGFWDLKEIITDNRALIPRPDTETLVELALSKLPEDLEEGLVLDVGTGTGAIVLSLAKARPNLSFAALDTSPDALALAQENAQNLELGGNVDFYESDLLTSPEVQALPACTMIVSNPPYIAEHERDSLSSDILDHEPELALFAGNDGLDVIRELIPQAHAKLAPGGSFLCEIGHTQGDAVRRLFEDAGFTQVNVARDLGKRDRVVHGIR